MRDVSFELDFNYETVTFQIVNEYGYLFFDKAKRKKHESNQSDEDPFIKRWPLINNSKIIDELKELGLLNPELQYYEGLYKNYCQWMHGTPQGFGEVFCYTEDRLIHDATNCRFMGATAILFGMEALARSLYLFNDHFRLSFKTKLEQVKDNFYNLK